MGGMKELAAMRRRQAQFLWEEAVQGASREPGSDDGAVDDELQQSRLEEDEEEEVNEEEVGPLVPADVVIMLTCR